MCADSFERATTPLESIFEIQISICVFVFVQSAEEALSDVSISVVVVDVRGPKLSRTPQARSKASFIRRQFPDGLEGGGGGLFDMSERDNERRSNHKSLSLADPKTNIGSCARCKVLLLLLLLSVRRHPYVGITPRSHVGTPRDIRASFACLSNFSPHQRSACVLLHVPPSSRESEQKAAKPQKGALCARAFIRPGDESKRRTSSATS